MIGISPVRTTSAGKSLRYSILDGAAHSAMLGLTQDYIVPFALALKATTAQIGLLCSIPSLASSLVQLAAPGITSRAGSRKGVILPATLMHALMWGPILLIPYLFPANQQVWFLLAFLTMSSTFGSVDDPAWASMMSDLVPEDERGSYFGLRGKICGLVAVTFFLAGGAALHFYSDNVIIGFSILFGGALVFRIASWYFLFRMHEPPDAGMNRENRLADTIGNMKTSNPGRFIVYVSLMYFATYLASPFFAVYMLRDLRFDYLTYMAATIAATLTNIVFQTYWGNRADMAGNIKVIKITSVLIPLVPLLWTVSHHLYYLIPVQMLSGFIWAGFNLASSNFLYDASLPQNKTQYIALFNASTGAAIFLGSLLGGFLASRLPPFLGYGLLTLFLISALLRAVLVATLLRHIFEVRQVPETTAAGLVLGGFGSARLGVRHIARSLLNLIARPGDEAPTRHRPYIASPHIREPPFTIVPPKSTWYNSPKEVRRNGQDH